MHGSNVSTGQRISKGGDLSSAGAAVHNRLDLGSPAGGCPGSLSLLRKHL